MLKKDHKRRLISVIAGLLVVVIIGTVYCPASSIVEAKEGDDTTTAEMRRELEAAFGDADAALQKATIKKYADTGKLTIVLDAGHDSTHHGATRYGLREEELTLKIAQYCKTELEKYQGVNVYLTRTSNACPNPGTSSTMDNYYRMVWASNMGADVYISLHLNVADSSGIAGLEVYAQNAGYRADLSAASHSLAWNIADALQQIGLSNAGVKTRNSDDGSRYPDGSVTDYYSVNHNSKMLGFPGIIVEHAYLTNAGDVQRYLSSDAGLQSLGIADARGIASYYGLSKEDYSLAFDASYYYNKYVDLQEAYGFDRQKLLNHYIQWGLQEGRVASPVFDINYYKKNNLDLVKAYGNDLKKYCTHFALYGAEEGRKGCANFDVHSYKLQYADLRQAYGNDLPKYYEHYIQYGYSEGRKAVGCTKRQGYVTTYKGVDYSAVYDGDYYLKRYADLRQAYGDDDLAALRHFVEWGMSEGRQASPAFDVYSYRLKYVDLRAAYASNLPQYYTHYIRWGKNEGRQATGCTRMQNAVTSYNGIDYADVYDYNDYISKNPDVYQAFGDDDVAVLRHFVTYGMNEGRLAKQSFNVHIYRQRYSDLEIAYGNAWKNYYLHYIQWGKSEGRNAIV